MLRSAVFCAAASALALAANPDPVPIDSTLINVNGIFPALTATADSAPTVNVTGPRSECGHGAMMAWNDKLYVISYLSVPYAGSGTGLYSIDQNMKMTKLANHSSVYANRMLHPATNQIIIGPYVIDSVGNIRTFTDLLSVRIGGMAEHIVYPDSKVYMLGMDGPLWECDLTTMSCTQLFDLVQALNIPASSGEQPHFKAAHTMAGTLWVASNTFEEADGLGQQHGGRLATWDGKSANWTILETTAFVEVTGRHNMGRTVFALGWDDASVILKVLDVGDNDVDPSYMPTLQTYRLPKAAHSYDHLWTTEWPRIREVETERYLMDMHGMFYELAPFTWGGAVWGVRPISQHLRMIPDFASYRGMLVLGGNQVSSIFDNNWVTGQSQSGLWFGKTDDLWGFGKPQGWGGPWRYDILPAPGAPVTGGATAPNPSDPYLMTGFDKKIVHFRFDPIVGGSPLQKVLFTIQVDFTGSAGHRGANFYMEPWNTLATVEVPGDGTGSGSGYGYYIFPTGFSAHWVRFQTDVPCNCTAYLHYT